MPAPGNYLVRHGGSVDRYYFTSQRAARKFALAMALNHGSARVIREHATGREETLERFEHGKRVGC